jgi:uncharacterized protein (TIGR04255 family)
MLHEELHVVTRKGPRIELPTVDLKRLPAAPLKVAVIQVQFAPCHAVEKRERVADFQEKLTETYVAEQPQTAQAITLQIGPGMPPSIPNLPAPETVWRFHDHARGWIVALSSSSLAVEASTYETFEDFAAEFESVLSSLSEVFAPTNQTRLGVRYINRIEGDGVSEKLLGIVEKELLSPVGTALGTDLLTSISDIRFDIGDGVMAIKHGLTDPDAYLLDFDCYSDQERTFHRGDIVERVRRFHDLIERLFVWSLTDEYLNSLRKDVGNE